MGKTGELLAVQMDGTREWTLKLIADLKGDDWSFQPRPGLGHPLFLCGHLAVSQNLLVHVRCLKASVLSDDFAGHFGIGKDVLSTKDHRFPSVETVLTTLHDVHRKTLAAVRGMSEDLLAEPAFAADGKSPHPHYRDKCGAVTHCFRHEAFHAGQLATIRRLLGRNFLR